MNTQPTMDDIRENARRIAEEFNPDGKILFGSWARGDQRPDSDVDLAVTLPLSVTQIQQAVTNPLRVPW